MTSQPHIQGRRETQGEEKKKIQANTLKKNKDISISFRSGFGQKKVFPNWPGCDYFLCQKMQFGVQRRVTPTNCQSQTSRQSWFWRMYDVYPYSMYRFLQLILDGTPTTHPRGILFKCRGSASEPFSSNQIWPPALKMRSVPAQNAGRRLGDAMFRKEFFMFKDARDIVKTCPNFGSISCHGWSDIPISPLC